MVTWGDLIVGTGEVAAGKLKDKAARKEAAQSILDRSSDTLWQKEMAVKDKEAELEDLGDTSEYDKQLEDAATMHTQAVRKAEEDYIAKSDPDVVDAAINDKVFNDLSIENSRITDTEALWMSDMEEDSRGSLQADADRRQQFADELTAGAVLMNQAGAPRAAAAFQRDADKLKGMADVSRAEADYVGSVIKDIQAEPRKPDVDVFSPEYANAVYQSAYDSHIQGLQDAKNRAIYAAQEHYTENTSRINAEKAEVITAAEAQREQSEAELERLRNVYNDYNDSLQEKYNRALKRKSKDTAGSFLNMLNTKIKQAPIPMAWSGKGALWR